MELKWQDPPGYQETANEIRSTNYGWAVINPGGGDCCCTCVRLESSLQNNAISLA